MLKIGALAKICNVSTQTLRYYDAAGVLRPDVTDPSSGYRFYSVGAVETYKQILFYKNLGFSLEEIRTIRSATAGELRGILQKKRAALSESVGKFREQIRAIDDLCAGDPKKPPLAGILLLPFEDDAPTVGKWRLCGRLLDENALTFAEDGAAAADREIFFLPGGAFAWKYFWTKGTLYRISPKYPFAIPNSYRAVEQNGTRYLIVRFMSDDCIDHGADPVTLLYRQIDRVAYTERQIRPRVDQTDLPYVDDGSVRGEWTVLDFVPRISDFDLAKRYSDREDLYTLAIRFFPRGVCSRIRRTLSGEITETLRYTKGFVLNDREMTAEEYRLISVGGKELLFVQHKSGDYFYGGMEPHWYVFERKSFF